MEDLKKAVIIELEKNEYNSIVTMDNFKQMKESSQFLGKVAKQISDFRIAKVKEETTDIKLFEDSLKKFTNMFKEKQETIKSGLDVFEEQTRQKVLQVCKDYFNEFCDQVQLRQEFRNINLDDMTQTGYATATFKISKKGIDEVERRVNIQLTLQTKVDNRLLNLENECLKANIEPLTQQHIQGFLYSSDEEYQIRLRNLIVSEIERNEAIKKREQEKAERELREKIEVEQREKLILENEEKQRLEDEVKVEEIKKAIANNQAAIGVDIAQEQDQTVYIKEETWTADKANQERWKKEELTKENFEKQYLGNFEILEDGKVRKFVTVTFQIVVPKEWESKVQSTYEKRFSENIKNVENMKVEVR